MKKNFEITLLLDFYGAMLTDKQREVIELYYCDDLSLSEIAQNLGITRQGVRDAIKRGENVLLDTEERLRLLERFKAVNGQVETIERLSAQILGYCSKMVYSDEIYMRAQKINDLAKQLND